MGYIPPVHAFVSFYELDPSSRQNCIYVLRNGNTCRWPRSEKRNNLAATLRNKIAATQSAEVSLDLLQEYIRSNCCMGGNAKHQERIEDVNLLEPLAQRWLDEINSHAKLAVFPPAAATAARKPAPIFDRSSVIPSPQQSRFFSSAPSPQPRFSTPSATPLSKYHQSESRPRYGLRSGDADGLVSSSHRLSLTSKPPISEFRPHVANPLPGDSVIGKIVEPLVDRDFETGSLYIFSRESSPGYVKIGWTAQSIQQRLDKWANCGYTPNLLFSLLSVKNARRVETLTHFELIKEWRRERRCKAPHCLKSHQEWFEISIERAAATLQNWADFMNRADPYGADGVLKSRWKIVVKMIEKRDGSVTSQKLLERYEKMRPKVATPTTAKTSLDQASKIKKEEETPVLLEHIHFAEQKTPLRQDNRSPKDIEQAVLSPEDDKLEKIEPNPTKELSPYPDPFKQELLPEEIPLPISPILPPLIDSAIDAANIDLAAISGAAETSQRPSERLATDVARVLIPLT
ncbi:uncharacterized protein PV07_12682 [Cladophialophora immunda]|uniref:Bacteriophage T5 Orf172 DNA-binding domain-containing protein n=1 Tax=Cladophialophora immunda TaxID=569365 RepID=A0A0D2BU08_9EURO|nr:uncharacterized protein PV07_12682 [Cladophialophora immunda]KIW21910.1 hypothetical protein PV07_12682 [Cladophialophora immunda]